MIYLALLIFYLLIVISFLIDERSVGMMSALGLTTVGIYIAQFGIDNLSGLLVEAISLISIAFGVFIFLAGAIQSIEETGI